MLLMLGWLAGSIGLDRSDWGIDLRGDDAHAATAAAVGPSVQSNDARRPPPPACVRTRVCWWLGCGLGDRSVV